MDPAVSTTPAPVRPLQTRSYQRVVNYASSGRETTLVYQELRHLSVATEIDQTVVNDILQGTRDPRLAAQRLLLIACSAGNQSLVEFLLPLCDVNAVGQSGETAISRAVQVGRLEIVQLLLDQGADPRRDGSYVPILRNALHCGGDAIVELVMQLAGDCDDVSDFLGNDRSLFVRAVPEDQVALASLLLAHGATVNDDDQDQGEITRSWLARSIQSVEMAELFYAHGFDFQGEVAMEAVIEAMCQRNTPLVQFYIVHGVDLRRFQYRTTSPLHCAVIQRDTDMMRLLAAQCIDLDARLEDGSTALQKCFTGGEDCKRVHQLLVELGADVNARSKTGVDSSFRTAPSWSKPIGSSRLYASKEQRN